MGVDVNKAFLKRNQLIAQQQQQMLLRSQSLLIALVILLLLLPSTKILLILLLLLIPLITLLLLNRMRSFRKYLCWFSKLFQGNFILLGVCASHSWRRLLDGPGWTDCGTISAGETKINNSPAGDSLSSIMWVRFFNRNHVHAWGFLKHSFRWALPNW